MLENARQRLAGNKIAVSFLCQGGLAPGRLAERLGVDYAGKHPMTPERRARLLEAAGHPDAEDLRRAREVFSGCLTTLMS